MTVSQQESRAKSCLEVSDQGQARRLFHTRSQLTGHCERMPE
jgi:hypothetical protein